MAVGIVKRLPPPITETPKVEISSSNPVLVQQGGNATVTFTTNAAWTASVSEGSRSVSWCSVSPTSGQAGTVNLTVTTTPNDTYDERNAIVTITAGTAKKTFSVTQKQKDALTVTSNKVELKAEGGNFTIEAQANVSVSYEIEETAKDWISASESRGLTTTTLNFTAKTNESTERRQGTITLKGGDGLTETVTVYQAGEEPSLVLTTEKEMTVGSEGGTLKIELQSNVEVKMEALEADWLRESSSRVLSSHTYYIEVDANETYDERNASVTFTAGELKQTVTITQKQKDALTVTSNKVELSNEGGNFSIEAQANVSVSYEIEEAAKNWISTSESRGLTTTTLNFTAQANGSTERRQGTITLKGGDGLTETVTVYQAGVEPSLVVSSDDLVVKSEGETVKIEVRSNVEYTMQLPDVGWISEDASRAASAYTHYLTVAPNDTYDSRTAFVRFVSESAGLKDSISISQLQQNALIVAKNEYEVKGEGDTLTFKVQANVEIEVATSADWITRIQPESRALTEQELTFAIDGNPDSENGREGTITIKSTDTGLEQVITVKQAAYQEPELVKIEYRPGWTWEEAHDNLPLLYYAHVDRDRYYSNGEVVTDHFVDLGHDTENFVAVEPRNTTTQERYPETKTEVYKRQYVENDELITVSDSLTYSCDSIFENDSIRIIYYDVEVNETVDLSTLKVKATTSSWGGVTAQDWENYVVSKLYWNESEEYPNITDFDSTNPHNGWYFANVGYVHMCKFLLNNIDVEYLRTHVGVGQYDQFLYIDGQMVDFTDYYPERIDNVTVEDVAATSTCGAGKKITHECKVKYLGRNFYSAVITHIYQRK